MSTATMMQEIIDVLHNMDRRERRKRLIALVGGQSRIARSAGVDRATVCRVVAGWEGGVTAAKTDGVIRHALRRISRDLEHLWAA